MDKNTSHAEHLTLSTGVFVPVFQLTASGFPALCGLCQRVCPKSTPTTPGRSNEWVSASVVQNVSSQVKKLQENALIQERLANGSLLVAGAFYEITSGIVDFFTLDKNGLVIDV
eukprot:EG_transcript_16789